MENGFKEQFESVLKKVLSELSGSTDEIQILKWVALHPIKVMQLIEKIEKMERKTFSGAIDTFIAQVNMTDRWDKDFIIFSLEADRNLIPDFAMQYIKMEMGIY